MAEEDNLIVDESGGQGFEVEHAVQEKYNDAEEAVLGIFMQDDESAAFIAQSGLREEHFLKRSNRLLYPIILNIRQRMGTCNIDFVIDECEKKNLNNGQTVLSFIGGKPKLMEILNIPIALDIKTTEGYLKMVYDQWKMSKVKEVTRELAHCNSYDENKIVDKVASLQSILSDKTLGKFGLVGIEHLLPDAIVRYRDRYDHPDKYVPIKTGFSWMDKYKVVAKKRTTIVAARTNVGKSVMVCNMVNAILDDGRSVILFTPEMDKQEYVDRMLCSSTNTSIDDWKNASLRNQEELEAVNERQRKLIADNPHGLFIEDRGSQSVGYIINTLRKHMLSYPVDVVVVDYIQKLRFKTDNIRREIDDAMDKLSSFAKDNDLAMIIVSQLRRVSSKESGEMEPRLSDLKESGNLENFADSVVLLHRYGSIDDRNKGWYNVAKNRTGRTTSGVVQLEFKDHCLLFRETDPAPETDVVNFNSKLETEEMDDLEVEARKIAEEVVNGSAK